MSWDSQGICPLFRAILAGKGRYGRQKALLHGI